MELRDYQRETVEWLREMPRAALLAEMGLGKTAMVLSALTPDMLPAVVVAPPRVASLTWPEEARVWRPDLRVAVAVGTPAVRAREFSRDADVYVVSVTTLGKTPPDLWGRVRTLVLDESSMFKSWSALRTKAATAAARRVPRVWLLTGTPVSNSLEDLYSQYRMLDDGRRLGRTLTTFRERWMVQGPVVGRTRSGTLVHAWEPRPGAEEEAAAAVSDLTRVLRTRDLGRVLPSSTVEHVYRMSRADYKIQRDLRKKFLAALESGQTVEAPTAATLVLRLRQVLAGAVTDETGEVVRTSDTRVQAAVDLAYQAIGDGPGPRPPGAGVIMWYAFQSERDAILEAMKGQAVLVSDRGAVERWTRGERPVLVAHPASAGHGLNLQRGGHHDIWVSLPWSLEHWDQACARLTRPGQEHEVIHHVLVAQGPDGQRTVDHAVADALIHKRNLVESLLSGL